MTSFRSRKETPPQLSFMMEIGPDLTHQLSVPPHLSQSEVGRVVSETLFSSKNRLRQDLPVGDGGVVDLVTGYQIIVYNRDNEQVKGMVGLKNLPYHLAAVTLVTPPLFEESAKKAVQTFKVYLNIHGGGFYILEQVGEDQNQEWRKGVFAREGLVRISVAPIKNRGVIFWQGRLPKPAEHKAHQVDLLAPRPTDPYGKRRWRESLIPNIIVQYERLGFTVVKPDEIKNRLHHSYNPPEDIQRAKLGFGVWLEASCGCRGRINLDGEAQAERLCDNEVCPWKTSFPLEIGRPKVEKPNYCGDCPGQILKRTYQARGNWRRIIEICPFHGEVNIGPWEL